MHQLLSSRFIKHESQNRVPGRLAATLLGPHDDESRQLEDFGQHLLRSIRRESIRYWTIVRSCNIRHEFYQVYQEKKIEGSHFSLILNQASSNYPLNWIAVYKSALIVALQRSSSSFSLPVHPSSLINDETLHDHCGLSLQHSSGH